MTTHSSTESFADCVAAWGGDLARAAVARDPHDQVSLIAEQIAQRLSDAQHVMVGAEPQPLAALLPRARDRFRHYARLAIGLLDTDARAALAEAVAADAVDVYGGGGHAHDADVLALARHVLAEFNSRLSGQTGVYPS